MKIGLIGDHISDAYIYGSMKRFSPESPIPIFDIEREEWKAGGASNVNNNLLAFGDSVDYYYNFEKEHVSVKRRYVCDGHIMFRCDEDRFFSPEPNEEFPKLQDCDIIILSDYNKGMLRYSQNIIHRFKEMGKTVIVDPKKSLFNYEGADIVKLNEEEYNRYSLVDGDYQDSRTFYKIGTFVITRADKGVTIVNDEGVRHIEGHKKQVSDVTGAGDIFTAALAHYLSAGKSIYKACELANQLASISVTKFGTYILTEEDIRSVEKRVVFTNGCFDILHHGHIKYLQQSKNLGDKLIVGLNSDASANRLKGEGRPINNQEDRKAVLENLSFVDEVIIFDEDTPYELIKRIEPDIITKGGDYKTDEVVGKDLAKVVVVPYLKGYSTSSIMEKINGSG